jgi:nucleoside-diphosphate-sugar epimerase
VNTLVREIGELLGVFIVPLYSDARPGDILHSFADIDKSKRVLGYEPIIGFKQGLRKTAAWYRERR